jgi:hypothetical protein
MVAFRSLSYTLLYGYGAMDVLQMYQAIPDLVPVVIVESASLSYCIRRNFDNADELDDDGNLGTWQDNVGCVKRQGFEDGIPIWKLFPLHFWAGPATPMGQNWTLSPEDWNAWSPGQGNHYLGKLHRASTRSLTARLLDRGPM